VARLAVAGDDLRAVVGTLEHLIDSLDQAVDGASAVGVQNGIGLVEPHFAGVEDVGVHEMDEGVGVGAGVGSVYQVQLFIVGINFFAVDEGSLRQRAGGSGGKAEVQHGNFLRRGQPGSDVFLADDKSSGRIHGCVAVRVIEKPTCVDEQLHRMGSDFRESVEQVRHGGRHSGINQELAVGSVERYNVCANALKQNDSVGELGGLNWRVGCRSPHRLQERLAGRVWRSGV